MFECCSVALPISIVVPPTETSLYMSAPKILDPVLLRSFLAVADTGSFTRAADSVHLTQSTVSQQIRRLELQFGCDLLDRNGRYVATTPEGERLLAYGRRIMQLMDEAVDQVTQSVEQGEIQLGVPEDFAAHALTPILAAFAENYPGIRLEITSGLSHELWRLFQQGKLDMALVKQRQGSAPGIASWPEPLCWVDSRVRPAATRNPIPLVAFPIGGLYRNEMTHALDATGQRWRIGFVSTSLASVSAAVQDGLGVSLLPRRLAGQHKVLDEADGFAPVPDLELSLHVQDGASTHTKTLTAELVAACDVIMTM